jgi:hypothetical protein
MRLSKVFAQPACRLMLRNLKSSPTNGLKENDKHQTIIFVLISLLLALMEAGGKWERHVKIMDCVMCRQ